MTDPPACPAPDCCAPVDLLNDANAAGRTWNCPNCARWGVAWSAGYRANQPFGAMAGLRIPAASRPPNRPN
ncbi:hypothetical protein [Kitasatospora sp. NPDC059803]|uniref:hypothetical protein n=1 Tax=Kitasatospora sp. NPDC059803 TaxID=3346953 RepID=UPI00366931AB